MTDRDWIDADTACALLGVRRQTLYAYVSRKLLRAGRDDTDPRRSLYARADVEHLARKHSRARSRAEIAADAIRWGDPVLDTAISGVTNGVLHFGAEAAADLARHMTLEDVAAHHCRVNRFALPDPAGSRGTSPPDAAPLDRALACLAELAGRTPPIAGRNRAALAREGADLLARIVDAITPRPRSGPAPVHRHMASAWGLESAQAEQLRRALVLISDHELNPSTFAVRICASTGASLAACLMAGLCALSGPRHGGVASKARAALDAMASGDAAIAGFLAENPNLPPYAFGYGHPLYPGGDCRATALLNETDPTDPSLRAVGALADLVGEPPNIDAALAALARRNGLPDDAALVIFAVGRTTGWLAHAIEQAESDRIIRPRARFLAGAP